MRAIRTSAGFVLPVVLGIILLAAMFAMHAATELVSTAMLASQRQLHQRAFEAGEGGIVAVIEQLRSGTVPAARQELRSTDFPTDSATVQFTQASRLALPNGYSAGRVFEAAYEIRSTGHSARTASVTVVQGIQQLQVVGEP